MPAMEEAWTPVGGPGVDTVAADAPADVGNDPSTATNAGMATTRINLSRLTVPPASLAGFNASWHGDAGDTEHLLLTARPV
jgi:hypothetical protein